MPTDGAGIQQRLVDVLITHLKRPLSPARLGLSTPLYGRGLGLSSLDVVSLIVKLEEEFEVFFEADEIASSVQTLGTLVAAVERKIEPAASPGDRAGH